MPLSLRNQIVLVVVAALTSLGNAAERPNIILIIADDLGYAELGSYGQKKIKTPSLDRLASEGMRFTQFYAGNAVCATSRCTLMTGKHTGHAFIRDNRAMKPEGQYPIPDSEVTIAEVLKGQGYATGAMGKWGLGPVGSTGDPNKQGFDLFYGYNCQGKAHNHYPTHMWRNSTHFTLEGNDGGDTGKQFSHDLFEAEALKFIDEHRAKPFFLFLPFTIPHLALQVPEDSLAEYKGQWEDPPYTGGKGYRPHAAPRAAYAAMITRMDRSVGRIMERLKKHALEENTLVLFTSDNGPTYDRLGGSDSDFFESAGPFRGLKGSLYEGGIRVPLIARWPGKIKPGTTSDVLSANYDLLPTLCEIAGMKAPAGIDGLSLATTLLGRGKQPRHKFLYWEFPSYGGQQAVRMGDWKGVRQQLAKGRTEIELYNLADDIGEKKNMAKERPEIVERIAKLMLENHVRSEVFPLKGIDTP
jgi:arylsulfatase A